MRHSKIISIVCLFLFSISSNAAEPSSEIPAKREFPLSSKVNPCDNFHEYVCSEAEAAFKLRDDRSRHTFSFNDSSERILEAKKDFFSKLASQKKVNPRTAQIQNTYLACMNEKAGAKNEKRELDKLVAELSKLNNTEAFAKWNVDRVNTYKTSFIGFDAYSNQDNPEKLDVILMTDLSFLPEHSYYENAELMTDYKKLMIDFFKIVFSKQSEEAIQKRVDKALDFEKEFMKVYPKPEVMRQRWSERRQEDQQKFLAKYPRAMFEKLFKQVPKSTLVQNSVPEGLDFYETALAKGRLDELKDLTLFQIGIGYMDDSQPEFFKKYFEFSAKHLGGPPVRAVRHERCTRTASGSFPKELDQVLIKQLFPNFPSDKFKAVAQKIRESIVLGLKNNKWLEESSRQKAILKIEKAKLYLVQPENDLEWDFFPIRQYSKTDRFKNREIFVKTYRERKIERLRTGANLKAWDMGPLTVNAYYDPSANKFVMPMGILQYPFFNPDGDLIENLGAVGAVIGHELGHGVDDQGSKYDENGKLSQWMSMKDLAEFANRGRRLIEFFNKAGHNGALSLGENIGDLVGLTFAYNAMLLDRKPTIEEKKKLFIAYARLWCGVARPKAEEEQLKTGPHALGRARINEQVKHQPGFAEAFSCKKGDKMNLPEDQRVQIW